MNVLVSVIIPIYGVEPYLDACIDSVVSQTYKNLEILLIDDGSKDKCPLLCDLWAQKDKRIHVIHKKNEGLARARATGLKYASGEYIVHVDSDDWIDPNHIETMINAALQNNSDIVICDYCINYPERQIVCSNAPTGTKGIEVSKDCLVHKIHAGVVFRMVKRQFFNDIEPPTPDYDFFEDMFTSIYCQMHTNRITHVAASSYHYRFNNKSLTNNSTISKRIKMYCQCMENIISLDKILSLSSDLQLRRALYEFYNLRKYYMLIANLRYFNEIKFHVNLYEPDSLSKKNRRGLRDFATCLSLKYNTTIPIRFYFHIMTINNKMKSIRRSKR